MALLFLHSKLSKFNLGISLVPGRSDTDPRPPKSRETANFGDLYGHSELYSAVHNNHLTYDTEGE